MSMESNEAALRTQLIEVLKENGVIFQNLVVAFAGAQIYMGEQASLEHNEHGVKLVMLNPRRFLPLEQVQGGVINARFSLIDFHLLTGKKTKVTLFPHAYFRVADQDDETQLRHLVLYNEYLGNKRQMTAKEAGIIIPDLAAPQQNVRQVR